MNRYLRAASPYRRFARRRAETGLTLVELMVALAVGSFLLIGAITVFVQSRETFRVVDSVSRLQENARFVLDALEPDVRMASYFGLTTRPEKVLGRAGPDEDESDSFVVSGDCGTNWTIHLDAPLEGSNNRYVWECGTYGGAGAAPNADTLVVRRAAEEPEAPAAGRLQIQSARFLDSTLFVGANLPAGYTAENSQTHRLIVNGYYVSETSTLSTPGNPVPSLRVKTLVDGPAIRDEEILPGVEDMQVQFGIDTDPPGAPNRGSVDRYVNPEDPLLDPAVNPDVRVLAVRIWLRLRSERPEPGFTDTARYEYADQDIEPFNDGYRRIVVSKTIYIRNARPAA
jgi:type IV pilus assembly protein PilW